MTDTPKAAIPLIDRDTTEGYSIYNEAMYTLDGLSCTEVLDKGLADAPANPSEGDLYIVASGTTPGDAWEDATTGDLAHYYNKSWHFYTPKEGWLAWISDETPKELDVYSGSSWQTLATL